jgi:RNA polymerase sigma factor (sigma-70 family)
MQAPLAPRSFQTTRWSLVRRAAGESPDPGTLSALTTLCNAYWYPVYAFIRRSGHNHHDTEDLTQGFFQRLLEKDLLGRATPERGKLRTFLLSCVRNYLINEHQRAGAAKRGAHLRVQIDPEWAENRYQSEPSDDLTPDRLFQRRWALTVLEHTLSLLEEESRRAGRGDLFTSLRSFLGLSPAPNEGYESIANRLGLPVGTLKSHVSRLRQRWKELLFEQVSITLDDPDSEHIKDELAELLHCL